MAVTSINAFRDMMRNGRYRGMGYMIQKLDTRSFLPDPKQGAYVLNKPLADSHEYHQTTLDDGRVLVFIGKSWDQYTVDRFINLYNQRGAVPATGRRSAGIIPSWRRNAIGWLDENSLDHKEVWKAPNCLVSSLLPRPNGLTGDFGETDDKRVGFNYGMYGNVMRGWYCISIKFKDEMEMERYMPRICVTERCWIYDKNTLSIFYACFYENNHVSIRYAQDVHLDKLKSMTGPINSCLWFNDEKGAQVWYAKYKGYMEQVSSNRYYEWGKSPASPERNTFQFLKDLVCLPPDQEPIEVSAALELLQIRKDNW